MGAGALPQTAPLTIGRLGAAGARSELCGVLAGGVIAGALAAGASRCSARPGVRGSNGRGPKSMTAPLPPRLPTGLVPMRACANALVAAQARQAAMSNRVLMLH